MNLINNLGHDFFNRKCAGAWILHNGEVCCIKAALGNEVHVYTDPNEAGYVIPADAFSGFKSLAYPKLGWRRLSRDTVAYLSKVQSAERGLRQNSINVTLSPVTRVLKSKRIITATVDVVALMNAVFKPKWDTKEDIPKMLAYAKRDVVLNEDVMIEPSAVQQDREQWDVLVSGAVSAVMDSVGRIKYTNPAHAELLQRMIG